MSKRSAKLAEFSANLAENSANFADLSDSERGRLRAPRSEMEPAQMLKFSVTIMITTESIVAIVLLLHALGRL
ncbi:MAG: hypothetical protein GEV13_35095 [Rhodospirillales bacterium]|nr:hypothetical protein [Rhodospirillales bacterium]